MGTCKDCKYWDLDHSDKDNNGNTHNACERDEKENSFFFIMGTLEGTSGYLMTMPEFGCNQYEAKGEEANG